MKELLKRYGIFLFLLITLQSCKQDDVYYSLSNDAKGFLLFEVDDTFKLKDLNTNEIITLTVTSKEFDFIAQEREPSGHISFGPVSDRYAETGVYSFTDSSNCYNGEVVVQAERDGFNLKAALYGCFGDSDYSYDLDAFFYTIDIQGIEHEDVYLLRSYPNSFYYSKEKGILEIFKESNLIPLFSYVD